MQLPLLWKKLWICKEEEKDKIYYKALHKKLDGNYRIRVIPRKDAVVPGFIPVGPEEMRAEISYGRFDVKTCGNCFKEGHIRGDPECQATLEDGWKNFVKNFNYQSK